MDYQNRSKPLPPWASAAALTIADAAPILGDTEEALARKVHRRTVPSVKVGGQRRIPVAYLLGIYHGNTNPGPTAA